MLLGLHVIVTWRSSRSTPPDAEGPLPSPPPLGDVDAVVESRAGKAHRGLVPLEFRVALTLKSLSRPPSLRSRRRTPRLRTSKGLWKGIYFICKRLNFNLVGRDTKGENIPNEGVD